MVMKLKQKVKHGTSFLISLLKFKKQKCRRQSTIDIYNQTKVSIEDYLKDRKLIWSWKSVGLTLYNDFYLTITQKEKVETQ